MSCRDNLIPQAHTLTVDEASKGGVNSGMARREKKAMREHLEAALQMEHYDLEGHQMTKAAAMTAALVERAISGDVSAARLIIHTIDGLPTVRAEVETAIPQETYEHVRRVLEGLDEA